MKVPRVPRLLPRLSRPTSAPTTISPPISKIGAVTAPNRNIATAPEPQADQGRAEVRTYVSTYFTKISADETQILYNGDRQWAKVKLTLETAGPVAVGVVQKITPVLSGKGIDLTTDVEVEIPVAKGTRLYIASTAVNRVKVIVEPSPWLEQITGLLRIAIGRMMK